MLTKISSPITGIDNCRQIGIIKVSEIEKLYQSDFKICVKKYFGSNLFIYLYECPRTGYRFFYPKVEGDSSFYEQLENYDWYYQENKWEYNDALKYVNPNSKVLEIGCGDGKFLKKIQSISKHIYGIELNESAVKKAVENGLNVQKKSIEKLPKGYKYDLIFCFQVIEHISDIRGFLLNCKSLLSKKGMLIFAVPNNDSIIFKKDRSLNLPPHHQGLWTESSIVNIANYLGFRVDEIKFEPLGKNHIGYVKEYIDDYFINNSNHNRVIRFIKNFVVRYFSNEISKLFINKLDGHSILAVLSNNEK